MNTTRHRFTDRLETRYLWRTDYAPNGSISGKPYVVSFANCGLWRHIDDNPHPGFRQRMAKGEVIISDVDLYESRLEPSEISATFGPHPDWGKVTLAGSMAGIQVALMGPWFDISTDRDRAKEIHLIKAYAKMNESPLLMGENLNEIAKTVQMLRRPLQNAADLVRKIAKASTTRKGLHGVKTFQTTARATSAAWLEQRYGWEPILRDAFTIASEVTESSVKATKGFLVARSGTKLSKKLSKGAGASGSGLYPTTCNTHLNLECVVQAGVVYSVLNRNLAHLVAKTAGLDARSLPATIWENLPYSFVADWAVNIGDWLQAVFPDPSIEVRGNWVTTVEKSTQTWTNVLTDFTVGAGSTLMRLHAPWSDGSNSTFRYKRETNLPLPLTPQLKRQNLSLLHSVDGISLMAQQLRYDIGQLSRPRR